MTAGLIRQGTAQVGLAAAGGSGDEGEVYNFSQLYIEL